VDGSAVCGRGWGAFTILKRRPPSSRCRDGVPGRALAIYQIAVARRDGRAPVCCGVWLPERWGLTPRACVADSLDAAGFAAYRWRLLAADEVETRSRPPWPIRAKAIEIDPDSGPADDHARVCIDPLRRPRIRRAMRTFAAFAARGAVFWGLFVDSLETARSFVEHLYPRGGRASDPSQKERI